MKSLTSSPVHVPFPMPLDQVTFGRRSQAFMMRCNSSSVYGTLLATRLAPIGGFKSLDTGPTDFGSVGSTGTHLRFAQNRKKLRNLLKAFAFARAPSFHVE